MRTTNNLIRSFGGRQIIALDTRTFPLDIGPFATCPDCNAPTTKVGNDEAHMYGYVCPESREIMWDHRLDTSTSALWAACDFEVVAGKKVLEEIEEAEENGELRVWW